MKTIACSSPVVLSATGLSIDLWLTDLTEQPLASSTTPTSHERLRYVASSDTQVLLRLEFDNAIGAPTYALTVDIR